MEMQGKRQGGFVLKEKSQSFSMLYPDHVA
jgi:hypothetical protein